jgi:aldose 1-epimerase
MPFTITTREGRAGDKVGPVYVLAGDTARIEVWPFLGFNCLRWQVRTPSGGWGDMLYTAPDWPTNPVPTRSGHPVLFPFPNRLSAGRFTFRGRTYQLPLNEASGKHAIHGFTPRNPWRVRSLTADEDRATITGQFRLSKDLPEAVGSWPGDPTLTLTYVLTQEALRVEAEIDNPGPLPLPCGLGYHPYLKIPTTPDAVADDLTLTTTAATVWEAEEGIPTGRAEPVPSDLDFRTRRPIGGLVLDRLFGDLGLEGAAAGELTEVARLGHRSAPGEVAVAVSPAFRQLLLFTPPHRQAVAIEPYTCASDAANLEDRGIDAGWAVLPPEGTWQTTVEYLWRPE